GTRTRLRLRGDRRFGAGTPESAQRGIVFLAGGAARARPEHARPIEPKRPIPVRDDPEGARRPGGEGLHSRLLNNRPVPGPDTGWRREARRGSASREPGRPSRVSRRIGVGEELMVPSRVEITGRTERLRAPSRRARKLWAIACLMLTGT